MNDEEFAKWVNEKKMYHHTEVLSPPLQWGPSDFSDRHLTGEHDEKLKFDPRCPKCVWDWTQKEPKE